MTGRPETNFRFYPAIKLVNDHFGEIKKWRWSSWSSHRLRLRQNGKGRKRGGTLKSEMTFLKEICLQDFQNTGNDKSLVSDRCCKQDTAPRPYHTQTFCRVRLRVTMLQRFVVFLQISSRTHCMLHSWLGRIPFPFPHSTPSLLDPPDKTIPCVPRQGLLFGRFACRSIMHYTSYLRTKDCCTTMATS